jgi:hypothetical protein
MMRIKKAELEGLVLQEVQRHFFGEKIQLSIQTDAHGVWFVAPRDPAQRFSAALQRAVVGAQIKLRPKYELDREDRSVHSVAAAGE